MTKRSWPAQFAFLATLFAAPFTFADNCDYYTNMKESDFIATIQSAKNLSNLVDGFEQCVSNNTCNVSSNPENCQLRLAYYSGIATFYAQKNQQVTPSSYSAPNPNSYRSSAPAPAPTPSPQPTTSSNTNTQQYLQPLSENTMSNVPSPTSVPNDPDSNKNIYSNINF